MRLKRYLGIIGIAGLLLAGGYGVSLSSKPFNPHEAPDCKSCHALHRGADGKEVLVEKVVNEEEVCFKCHQDPMQSAHASNVKREFLETVSHHPIFDYPAYGPERKSPLKKKIPQETVPKEIQQPESMKEREEWPKILKCHHCHNPHKVSPTFPLTNPRRPQETWRGSMVDFCLGCHDGSWAVDVKSIYTYRLERPFAGHRNPTRIPFDQPKPCDDCHASHGSRSARLLKERIEGKEVRVAQDLEGATAEGLDTFCLACHQSLAPGREVPRPLTHPMVIGGHSCTDCHNEHDPQPRVTNCRVCHTNIPNPLLHSNDRGGRKWGNYWTGDAESCLFCHGQDTHGLGLMEVFKGTNGVGRPVNTQSWCASCHIQTSSNYGAMERTFRGKNLPVPPGVLAGQPNYPASGSPYNHAGIVNAASRDDVCLACHSTPGVSASSQEYLYVHNVRVGLGGGPDCVGCHNLGGSAPRHVDVNVLMTSPHGNINSAHANGGFDDRNKPCWGCHWDASQDSGNWPASGHPANYKNPSTCEHCHTGAGAFTAPMVTQHHQTGSPINTGVRCTACHYGTKTGPLGGMTLTNADPDTGTFPGVDGNPVNGGTNSAEHYTRLVTNKTTSPYTHNALNTTDCVFCHNNAANGTYWGGATQISSIGGFAHSTSWTNANCYTCHVTGGSANIINVDFHTAPLTIPAAAGACNSCHGAPPATASHQKHLSNPTLAQVGTAYGSANPLWENITQNYGAASSVYLFNCGNCHPRDPVYHANGTTNVEFFPGTGTVRSQNPAGASYTPGAVHTYTQSGFTYTWTEGVCNNIYCHSSGQEASVRTYGPTATWGTTITTNICGRCHGNPPNYASGGAGAANANTHLVMADDGWEYGHFAGLPGAWHASWAGYASYHGMTGIWGVNASNYNCQTCHYNSVDGTSVDPYYGFYYYDTSGNYNLGGFMNYACTQAGCHTVQQGRANPVWHVNGGRNVIFDTRTTGPGSPGPAIGPVWVTAWPISPLPPNSQYDAGSGVFSLNLTGTSYNPASKTCSSVPCHLSQSNPGGDPAYEPLAWGTAPVGWATCNNCHQF